MLISEFDYHLPDKLIANAPARPRDYARLVVCDRMTGKMSLKHYYDLPRLLGPNDVLVFNNSKVIPARLVMEEDSAKTEILFLEEVEGLWKVMVKPGRKFKVGKTLLYKGLAATVETVDRDGYRYLRINMKRPELILYLQNYGQMPVPPYIKGGKYDNSEYNTVYSRPEGSVAAPTAGLHFTSQLLSRIRSKGVRIEFVTLHVGLGTFLPVKVKNIALHKMHHEKYEIDALTAKRLNTYLHSGKRLIAVGTTSVRVLEDNMARNGYFKPGRYNTNIFIREGYKWQAVNGLITNFHLPKSTLIMLVSAFLGRKVTFKLYEFAKRHRLKFFSFGDGMIIT
jgi:S-adenosylmethionine:tRNA ribosyltransferase-isomerase